MNSQQKVLVVEDSEHIRQAVGLFLRYEGIEHELTSDAEEALLALARASRKNMSFDAALLDLDLGGRSSAVLLPSLRRAKTRIIVFSASTTAHQQAKEMGADAVLEKPFSLEQLLHVLDLSSKPLNETAMDWNLEAHL